MPKLVLTYTIDADATGLKVEYSTDAGTTWTPSPQSPAISSPVTVLDTPPEGTYLVKITAIGDGTNFSDSEAVTSEPVEVTEPPEPLDSPVITDVVVEP